MTKRFNQLFACLLILSLILALVPAQVQRVRAISPDIVISQVYGGGGNSGATYTNDFIELFNRGASPVSLAGWSVQYASATGSTWQVTALAGTVQPGGYYLVQEAAGAGGTTPLPTPDASGSIAMSGSNGKVVVANSATALSGANPADASIVDVVGYGTANFFEGSAAAPGLNNTTSDSRAGNGCTDTDDNAADFESGAPSPRNSASPTNVCGGGSGSAVLVINEIDYDQPSTDTAEFVEIKNTGTGSADLSEYTLELVNGNGGGAVLYQTYTLPAVTLAAGGYYVVCGDATTVANCDLDVSPDSNLIQNGAPDGVGLLHNGVLVDAVSYEGDTGAPYTEGSGAGLEDNPSVENAGISRFPDGADTDQNNVDFSLRCSTPGDANVAESSNCVPPNTNLVINEIDYDQPGTDSAEFVEIKNNGDTSTDLTGWTLDLVNGNGAAVYLTIDLSGFTLAAGDYFVVCANAATVANCDLDVSPDTNLIQNGSPDAVALLFNGSLIDAVSYEGDTGAPYTEGSGAGLEDAGVDGSISRCPDGVDTNQNNVDLLFTGTSTPGEGNVCPPPPPVEACGDPFTPIYTVQGSGAASPLVGMDVSIEGIVVGDFQNNTSVDNGDLNGFHVQDPTGDGDAATSDGVFVYAPGGMDVAVGDAVRVRGNVSEFNGLTEVGASQIWQCSTGNALPAPAELALPVTSVDAFEAYEGMYVTFPQPLVISEYFNFDRFGEIVLTSERHLTPSAEFEPGPDAIAAANAFLLDKITLDDGRSSQNPDPAIHPNGKVFDLTNLFRGGDTVANVTGVMDYSFGLYRIQPTQGARLHQCQSTHSLARPGWRQFESGRHQCAELLHHIGLSTRRPMDNKCGPQENQECRGADDANELTRQRDKILAALEAIDGDVVGHDRDREQYHR